MRTNVTEKAPKIYTHEGARAMHIGVEHSLRRSVLSTLLFEDQFYENGIEIATRIADLAAAVLRQKNGAQKLGYLALEARTKFKLRHVPLWLIVALIRAKTEDARGYVAQVIDEVVQRPDEMGELLSLYWKANGGRKMLTAQMKKGLAEAFKKFDAYALGKYNSDNSAVKLRDVMFLIHGKPTGEQVALWKKIADNQLESPDTWEVALSGGADKKETFARLLKEKKLGALALLRNLRNMQQAGVDEDIIRTALAEMKTERVLPYRFITAARYAPSLEPELEQAMFKCLADYSKLKGKTKLVIDVSGSMDSKLSGKSELTRMDAAIALAMMAREVCETVDVITFSDRAVDVRPRRGFALRDEILRSQPHSGTNTEYALRKAYESKSQRIIVITDEQSHQSISAPQNTEAGYFINVASSQNGIGYGPWMHIDGFSEAVLDFIQQSEEFEGEE